MKKKSSKIFRVAIICVVVIVFAFVLYYFLKSNVLMSYTNDTLTLKKSQRCPPGTTDCYMDGSNKPHEGGSNELVDCCDTATEECGRPPAHGCGLKEGKPCPPEKPVDCRNGFNTGKICCTAKQTCGHDPITLSAFCAPKDCTNRGEPCKSKYSTVCCLEDPPQFTCELHDSEFAYCKPNNPKCTAPSTLCGNFDSLDCCKPGQTCVLFGSLDNTPKCLPENPTSPQTPG